MAAHPAALQDQRTTEADGLKKKLPCVIVIVLVLWFEQ